MRLVHRGAIAAARGACAVIQDLWVRPRFTCWVEGMRPRSFCIHERTLSVTWRRTQEHSVEAGDSWATRVDPKKLSRSHAAPAFRPIEAVMRAQRELVTIARRVWPLVSHKGLSC